MPIRDLATHPAQYVTVAELAEYWAVSRQQIHKRIEAGTLGAIRLGKRLYRVRTQQALEFERRASVLGMAAKSPANSENDGAERKVDTSALPEKIGLRRVRGD